MLILRELESLHIHICRNLLHELRGTDSTSKVECVIFVWPADSSSTVVTSEHRVKSFEEPDSEERAENVHFSIFAGTSIRKNLLPI